MGWLKRNLFFAIGVLVAVALLGLSVFYILSSSARNQKDLDQLNEIYNQLRAIKPGTDNQENIDAAKKQAEELRHWIDGTRDYFQPIEPVPATDKGLTDDAFATALHHTITQLQKEADSAGVALQTGYNFSFQAQSDKARFAPQGSVEKLAVQLGEVKTISEIFFAAHVNALDGIQRLRVSDDDTAGAASDYIDDQPMTARLATLTPYQVTFRGFSAEIGDVLAGFATSPHGFLIKSINVQPASAPSGDQSTTAPAPVARGPQTVLDEQMLRVTLMIEVVKLSRN